MVVNTSRSLLCTLYREAVSFTSDSRLYKNAFLSRQVFHWQRRGYSDSGTKTSLNPNICSSLAGRSYKELYELSL
uniref:Uncharacterized protein n=1 Tax=Anguilla anguilla TaxID=7936 RepID=A0A0E9SBI1_ANGAN